MKSPYKLLINSTLGGHSLFLLQRPKPSPWLSEAEFQAHIVQDFCSIAQSRVSKISRVKTYYLEKTAGKSWMTFFFFLNGTS